MGRYLASVRNQRPGSKSSLSTEVTVEAPSGRKGRAPEGRPHCPYTHQEKAVRYMEGGRRDCILIGFVAILGKCLLERTVGRKQ